MTQNTHISSLQHPADLQMREHLSYEHVEDLSEAIRRDTPIPPLDVVQDSQRPDAYWLVDGHHRLAAFQRSGITGVPIHILRRGTREDARWLACGANKTNALKRTNPDKLKAVKAALALRPEMSLREIADHCGVSHQMVADQRKLERKLDPKARVSRVDSALGFSRRKHHSEDEKRNTNGIEKRADSGSVGSDDEAKHGPLAVQQAKHRAYIEALRVAHKAAHVAFVFDKTKQPTAPYVKGLSWQGTAGMLNELIRDAERCYPVSGSPSNPRLKGDR